MRFQKVKSHFQLLRSNLTESEGRRLPLLRSNYAVRFGHQREGCWDDGAIIGGSRFAAYVEGLVSVIGHADRASPLRDYCLGLIMPCERKSVEPMAAVTAPDRTAAKHQSPLHFVGQSPWSNERVLAKVGEMVLPAIERHGPIEAWIIDDTGFPKKGTREGCDDG